MKAQDWLDIHYPLKKRKKLTELNIRGKYLIGELVLVGFSNLTKLDCTNNSLAKLVVSNCSNLTELNCSCNGLTGLNVSNCPNLTKLECYYNKLTNLNFLKNCHPDKLTWLEIKNNNFSTSDLTIFSSFINLEGLWIGSDDQDNINQNIYNRFTGSLAPLQSLTKLRNLNISNTDINSGLECLPNSLEGFYCSTKRPTALVKEIAQTLEVYGEPKGISYISLLRLWKWNQHGFTEQRIKEWIKVGLKPSELDFLLYLKNQNITPQTVNWQHWVTFYYPTVKSKKKVTKLNLSEKNKKFSGELDIFSDFINLTELNISNNDLFSSLEPFKAFTKLIELNISHTKIDSGLEYLPASLEKLYCEGTKLEAELKDYKKVDGSYDYQAWRKDHQELIKETKKLSREELEDLKTQLVNKDKELELSIQSQANLQNQLKEKDQQLQNLQQVNQITAIKVIESISTNQGHTIVDNTFGDNTNLSTNIIQININYQQIKQLEKEKLELEKQIAGKQSQINANLADKEKLEKEIAELQSQITNKDQQITKLKEENQTLIRQLLEIQEEETKKEVSLKLEITKQKEEEKINLNSLLINLQTELLTSDKEKENLLKKLLEKEELLATSQEELQETSQRLQNMQNLLEELENILTNPLEEIDKEKLLEKINNHQENEYYSEFTQTKLEEAEERIINLRFEKEKELSDLQNQHEKQLLTLEKDQAIKEIQTRTSLFSIYLRILATNNFLQQDITKTELQQFKEKLKECKEELETRIEIPPKK